MMRCPTCGAPAVRNLKPDSVDQRAGLLPRNQPTYRYMAPFSPSDLYDLVFAAAKDAHSIAPAPSIEWLRSFTEQLVTRSAVCGASPVPKTEST